MGGMGRLGSGVRTGQGAILCTAIPAISSTGLLQQHVLLPSARCDFSAYPALSFSESSLTLRPGELLIQRASLNRFLAGIGDGGLLPFMINMTEIDLISYDL
jgi:hypothetical protein